MHISRILILTLLILLATPAFAVDVGRDFNPALSVNTLLLFSEGLALEGHEHEDDAHATAGEGLAVQETEIQFSANIDPYAGAKVTLAMHGDSGIEAEEAYLELLRLPRGLGLRAGAFLWEFGKQNSLHTHQYSFVERPVAWEMLLGEHGLSGPGIELSWLSPLPWYAELIATAATLGETVYGLHDAPTDRWSGGLRLRQLWDLTDRATFDLGASGFGGDTGHLHEETLETGTRLFLGLDGTFKWTGTGANPRQLEIQGEWLRRRDTLDEETLEEEGFAIGARARVTRRLWLGGRFDTYRPADHEEHDHADDTDTWTLSLALVPSEFQAWRIDLMRREIGGAAETGLRAQANFTIGSHPAHRY
jgi:hypothetical protein